MFSRASENTELLRKEKTEGESGRRRFYETDKTLSMKRLFVSGINVGRDMMGTMTNTLIFAYVGGAMTTLVINYAYDLSYRQLANSYVIGIEIMQGLSGSLGVVLTVPILSLIHI